MEAGDEGDGEETLRVHFSPQEEVSLQIVEAKVVLTERKDNIIHLITSTNKTKLFNSP